ncbi:MAG: xanthine phosphoribosyltransferase [Caldilineales bacterium]|nr:xanthine phosphoribosyltransferase [Caldilineales bacterium]MDW8317061.1 xanthine phosphoribosyltransferase [Anaerolineae bacterium]
MEILKERILRDGVNLGNGILKVDSFINHQVDPTLMLAVGGALAARFAHLHPNKVFTAEISGIAPAFTTALALGVPVLYARKTKPITMHPNAIVQQAPSHTKGRITEIIVSPEFLGPRDRVLIVDDFLATGQTIDALARLVADAGARLVGIGAVIEKTFEGGRAALARWGVPIEALAVITNMDNGKIVFAE